MFCYLQAILISCVILPICTQPMLRMLPKSVSVSRFIECYSSHSPIIHNDYQLCVFRVYMGDLQMGRPMEFTIRNGMWYTNTFRQLLKRCKGFPANSDIGMGDCSTLPYETHMNMSICICAEDLCNIDWATCERSNSKMSSNEQLKIIFNDLSKHVACSGLTELLSTPKLCMEHPWIDINRCIDYITNNSVLCSILTEEGAITKESLTADIYERALATMYHAAILNGNTVTTNFTTSYLYFGHQTPFTIDESCVCNTFDDCNLDTKVCRSLTLESAAKLSARSTTRASSTSTELPPPITKITTASSKNGGSKSTLTTRSAVFPGPTNEDPDEPIVDHQGLPIRTVATVATNDILDDSSAGKLCIFNVLYTFVY